MSYLLIYDSLLNHIKEKYPNREVNANIGKSWHDNRFIQIYSSFDDNIHYEYIRGRVCLHFEGDTPSKYKDLIDYLMHKTDSEDMIEWGEWNHDCWCCEYLQTIDTIEQLDKVLDVVMALFDKLIEDFFSDDTSSLHRTSIAQKEIILKKNVSIDLYTFNLKEILGLPLSIPDYQRIYCWEQHHVMCLLNDICNHLEFQGHQSTTYRLGTIILHHHDDKYDIIDGQQRLVTLSLLLSEMGISSKLLEEKFASNVAKSYIAYNKYLIQNYLQKNRSRIKDIILSLIDFNVLILQNASLDLAYTFFSNENSRGLELSDYDLLKAHHLRFIPSSYEAQSRKVAEGWNNMLIEGRGNTPEGEIPDYERTLETYIYCLRRWMRQKDCEFDKQSRYLKREYEAAPIIDEIPPFGERFYFNEPIQGGTHFFSFVERHINIYRHFVATKEYDIIHKSFSYGSDVWYRDVIEALLFGYYMKFREICFTDALILIMRAVLQHRYQNGRARKLSIMRYASEQRYVLMIDQATSPTFFLAEVRNIIKDFPVIYLQNLSPTQKRVKQTAKNISKELDKYILIESFKTLNK